MGGAIGGAVANSGERRLAASVLEQGTTGRLGVAPAKPTPSFPLGQKSNVPSLGQNYAQVLAKPTHKVSQQFTNSFPADGFYF